MENANISLVTVLVVLLQLRPSWVVSNILEFAQTSLNSSKESEGILDFALARSNYPPPDRLVQSISQVLSSGNYSVFQYGIPGGSLRLREAIARFYSKLLSHSLISNENIVTTAGSMQALDCVFKAFTKPRDEWIFFEPFYDHFIPSLDQASGIMKLISLKPRKTGNNVTSSDWIFDKTEFSRLFNNNTRGIVINNPHNPIGKVFTYEELEFIAKLAIQWNVLVISDEVYEFLIFNDRKHIRIATLPNMFERTITVSSITKSYSATGIRVGWAIGPKELIKRIIKVHFANVISNSPFVEEGVSIFLEEEFKNYGKSSSYVEQLKKKLESKRNYVINYLRKVGLNPITIPEAGMFIIANWAMFVEDTSIKDDITEDGETSFVNWLSKKLYIKVKPLSLYYSADNKHLAVKGIRFIFAKTDDQLSKAEQALVNWKEHEKKSQFLSAERIFSI